MISYAEALKIIDSNAAPLTPVERRLSELAGCATAADAIGRLNVPPFDNSAMDGFTLRAADTVAASESAPTELEVIGVIAAGDAPRTETVESGAMEIMTGAPMPAGCDTVVPVERVDVTRDDQGKTLRIKLTEPIEPGRHVRRAGQDFVAEESIVPTGRLLRPHSIMGLAATGVDTLATRPAPRIAVITTGSELTQSASQARDGLICDSSGPYLEAVIRRIGATLSRRSNVPDSAPQLRDAIAEAAEDADIVLTTGGVSAGRFDLVPEATVAAGGEIRFHKVSIRPGKPLLFAGLPKDRLLFGLPGNPIAVAACMRFFVIPAVRQLLGLGAEQTHAAQLTEGFRKPASLRFFGKAQAEVDASGRLGVRLLPGQESFRIKPLTNSNCWAILEDGQADFDAGALVRIAPLYPTGFLQ